MGTRRCTYEALNYGSKLPYSKDSMIDHSCISCKAVSDNASAKDYWDGKYNHEETKSCGQLYEESGKCEENLKIYVYHNNYGCAFIKSLKSSYLPQTKAARCVSSVSPSRVSPSRVSPSPLLL